eukprot:scaffold184271_cov39-Attheya_sp.AAC.1
MGAGTWFGVGDGGGGTSCCGLRKLGHGGGLSEAYEYDSATPWPISFPEIRRSLFPEKCTTMSVPP